MFICDSRTTLSLSAQPGPLCSGDRLRRLPLSPDLPCKALAAGTLGEALPLSLVCTYCSVFSFICQGENGFLLHPAEICLSFAKMEGERTAFFVKLWGGSLRFLRPPGYPGADIGYFEVYSSSDSPKAFLYPSSELIKTRTALSSLSDIFSKCKITCLCALEISGFLLSCLYLGSSPDKIHCA